MFKQSFPQKKKMNEKQNKYVHSKGIKDAHTVYYSYMHQPRIKLVI